MQNLSKLFYPAPSSDEPFYPSKAQEAYHFNSPISQANNISRRVQEDEFEYVSNPQRSNSNRFELYQNNLFDSAIRPNDGSTLSFVQMDRARPSNISCFDQEQVLFGREQSPEVTGLQRGRSLTTQSQKSSNRKKGVLVIKRESINRQNSFSRSPTGQENKISRLATDPADGNQGDQSPTDYYSPKVREFPRLSVENSASQDVCRESTEGTSMKNSVIVRKTVGELKRAQLNVFYFDNQQSKNTTALGAPRISMPFAPTHSGQRERDLKCEFELDKLKGFEMNVGLGRNSLGSNYQHFIQRTDSKQSPNQANQQIPTHILSRTKPQHQLDISSHVQTQKNESNQNQQRVQKNKQIQQLSPSKKIQTRLEEPIPQQQSLSLSQKYAQNRNMRDVIREKFNQSSGSDEFDRQSSNNTISVENLNYRSNQNKQDTKKIVIQKNKVNFMNMDSEATHHLTKSQGQIVKVSLGKTRDSLISLNDQRRTSADKLDQLKLMTPLVAQSQSPDCLRRQKSDNLLSMHQHNRASLNHEKSQNHLSLYTSNKLEVPKVLKAVPGTFCQGQEQMHSPVTANSSKKNTEITEKGSSSGANTEIDSQEKRPVTDDLNVPKSRQPNNIFQVRRSQTVNEEKNQPEQKNSKVVLSMSQKRENLLSNEKYPSKKKEQGRNTVISIKPINSSNSNANKNEASRVSQSLLLDNFYSKSKDRLETQRKIDDLNNRNQLIQDSSLLKSSEIQQHSTMSSLKEKKDDVIPKQVLGTNSNFIAQKAKRESVIDNQYLNQLLEPGKRNTLSYSLNRLIDENRCNSPVRLSQYLVDIDYLKAKAQERISNVQVKSDIGQGNGGIQVYGGGIGNIGRTNSISYSNSNNAILSLSSVNTTEKFKEIIDFLFVPTASAFKKKSKEKEFRRPTQNPIRRSKSQQRGNKQQAVPNMKGKDPEMVIPSSKGDIQVESLKRQP